MQTFSISFRIPSFDRVHIGRMVRYAWTTYFMHTGWQSFYKKYLHIIILASTHSDVFVTISVMLFMAICEHLFCACWTYKPEQSLQLCHQNFNFNFHKVCFLKIYGTIDSSIVVWSKQNLRAENKKSPEISSQHRNREKKWNFKTMIYL